MIRSERPDEQLTLYPTTRSRARETLVSPALKLVDELLDVGYCLTPMEEKIMRKVRNGLEEVYRELV
jgi:hypothetical protein